MTENQFDDFFRKKLQHHESAVPEDMWERINNGKNKRRRFIVWWSLAAVLLIGITAGSYFLMRSDAHKDVAAVKQTGTNSKSVTSSQNKTSGIDTSNSTQSKFLKEGNIQDRDIQQEGIAKEKSQNERQKKVFVASDDYSSGKKQARYGNKPAIVPMNNAPVKAGMNNETTQQQKDIYAGNNNQPRQAVPQQDKQTMPVEDTLRKPEEAKNTTAMQNNPSDTSLIPNAVEKKKKERTPKDKYIEFYASPDYAWKQTSSANRYSDYLKAKNGAEQSWLSFSVGLRYVQMLNSHFFIKTGLQYSQVNERFKYKSLGEYRTISVDVSRNILMGNGTYTSITSRSLLRQVGYRMIEENNRYSSFDIPLLIGYETNGSSSFKASVTSGVIFNIHSKYKGYIVDSTFKAVNINDAGAYKTSMGTSLYFSLGLSKQISDNLSLFGEPYIRYRLSNMTKASQPFNQKIHSAGLSIGLRYKF